MKIAPRDIGALLANPGQLPVKNGQDMDRVCHTDGQYERRQNSSGHLEGDFEHSHKAKG